MTPRRPRSALAALRGVVAERANFLVVLERADAVTWLSLRNAHEVHIVAVDQLNTYDVLAADDLVFTRGAYDAFVGGTASSSERPAALVATPAAEERAESRPRPRPSPRPRRRPRRRPSPRSRR